MAAELTAGSGGLGVGWWKAWAVPHCFCLILPKPHSDGVPHEALPALGGWQRLMGLVLQVPSSHVLLVLSALSSPPPLSTE